ncbi:hypothetical protein NKJ26_27205 [Mesorhizobium sp. M0152]|uniref:hypothetical protein n=1 Tax=Mesorhizobium sp. M0152 TaxID=2956898 RepID=UPI00333B3808
MEQRATVLEIEMLISAIARIGTQAHRQYEIDRIHLAPIVACAAISPEIVLWSRIVFPEGAEQETG